MKNDQSYFLYFFLFKIQIYDFNKFDFFRMYFVSGGVYDIAKEGIISMVFGGGAANSPSTPPQNQQPGGAGYQNSSSTFYDASGSHNSAAKLSTDQKISSNQFSSNQEHSSFGGSGSAQFHAQQQHRNNFDFNQSNDALLIRNTTRG